MLGVTKIQFAEVKNKLSRGLAATLSILLAFSIMLVTQDASAIRFTNRSLFAMSSIAGDTTTYIVSLTYPTTNVVGSLVIEFCDDPIPTHPCVPPSGLNVGNAVLEDQSGEVGFTISTQETNRLVLSRTPTMTGITPSSYEFSGAVNPSGPPQSYYARLTSHASSDGSGPLIDFGSIANVTAAEIGVVTQVPPILRFCVAKEIPDECDSATGGNLVDFGVLSPDEVSYTSSQMHAFTNSRNGYSISVTGQTMTAGMYEIPKLDEPSPSLPGQAQFGINMAVNQQPEIGQEPFGPALNTTLNAAYTTPDEFHFNSGDVLVTSDGVTRNKTYTVSYIVNVPADQHPGVYSTTLTYVCAASF